MRRRGDAWYLNSVEPLPDGVAIASDFDPLQDMVAQAHDAGLQIHAYVVVADIWNQIVPPANPTHVFNQHASSIVGDVPPDVGQPQVWIERECDLERAVARCGRDANA